MLIQEMTRDECIRALARLRFGRLGCARDNQPHVVPIFFSYHENYLYAFSTIGQKIEWMRENPLTCVQADEINSPNQWLSVVALGRYEELPDLVEFTSLRTLTHQLLHDRAAWWQPAYVASPLRSATETVTPVFYRIRIDALTGHHGMPHAVDPAL
jgi:uncharacterized protein